MNIEQALQFASEAHSGQMYGENPYIVHPKEAARIAEEFDYSEDVIIGCLLHDVIEDTDITAEGLLTLGVPGYLVEAVVAVTYTEEDEAAGVDKIAKAMSSPLAHAIKYCDSTSNFRESSHPNSYKHHKMEQYADYLRIMDPRPTLEEVQMYINEKQAA